MLGSLQLRILTDSVTTLANAIIASVYNAWPITSSQCQLPTLPYERYIHLWTTPCLFALNFYASRILRFKTNRDRDYD